MKSGEDVVVPVTLPTVSGKTFEYSATDPNCALESTTSVSNTLTIGKDMIKTTGFRRSLTSTVAGNILNLNVAINMKDVETGEVTATTLPVDVFKCVDSNCDTCELDTNIQGGSCTMCSGFYEKASDGKCELTAKSRLAQILGYSSAYLLLVCLLVAVGLKIISGDQSGHFTGLTIQLGTQFYVLAIISKDQLSGPFKSFFRLFDWTTMMIDVLRPVNFIWGS